MSDKSFDIVYNGPYTIETTGFYGPSFTLIGSKNITVGQISVETTVGKSKK